MKNFYRRVKFLALVLLAMAALFLALEANAAENKDLPPPYFQKSINGRVTDRIMNRFPVSQFP